MITFVLICFAFVLNDLMVNEEVRGGVNDVDSAFFVYICVNIFKTYNYGKI